MIKDIGHIITSDKPIFCRDLRKWYYDAIDAIKNIYGEISKELLEFQSVKLLPHSTHADIKELLEKEVEDIEVLDNSLKNYYEERVWELREQLLAIKIELQKINS